MGHPEHWWLCKILCRSCYLPTEIAARDGISDRQPLSMNNHSSTCHPDRSEAQRRDLRFYRPFVEMFLTSTR